MKILNILLLIFAIIIFIIILIFAFKFFFKVLKKSENIVGGVIYPVQDTTSLITLSGLEFDYFLTYTGLPSNFEASQNNGMWEISEDTFGSLFVGDNIEVTPSTVQTITK